MYRISKKSSLVDVYENMGGVQTFSYQIEVFNINEPEKIYKYRMPNSAEKANDPFSFTSEVFNLINYTKPD